MPVPTMRTAWCISLIIDGLAGDLFWPCAVLPAREVAKEFAQKCGILACKGLADQGVVSGEGASSSVSLESLTRPDAETIFGEPIKVPAVNGADCFHPRMK